MHVKTDVRLVVRKYLSLSRPCSALSVALDGMAFAPVP